VNTRLLTNQESANLQCLNSAGRESVLLFVTETGLKKAIFDATDPMRKLLHQSGIHDYGVQKQGPDGKVLRDAVVHTRVGGIRTRVSLYRPLTKEGDPRIWFYGFQAHAKAGDVCAVFAHASEIHVLNLTLSNLAAEFEHRRSTPETEFFAAITRRALAVAADLLERLQKLAAAGPLEATCSGDTAIGRSIELALGLKTNSSKNPDYHGIEIKTGRTALQGRENRATLFACVPDWELSRCQSSKQILDEYGYDRAGVFKLYCTITSRAPNSQGLIFEFEEADRWLREVCANEPRTEVAVWRLARLEESLARKHNETFWIKANSVWRKDREHFELISVTHTRNPNLPQLERMLRDGTVTMDHLIKRLPGGGAAEKGPLFKIVRARLPELFLGEPTIYALN
jgi:hypothetical protein